MKWAGPKFTERKAQIDYSSLLSRSADVDVGCVTGGREGCSASGRKMFRSGRTQIFDTVHLGEVARCWLLLFCCFRGPLADEGRDGRRRVGSSSSWIQRWAITWNVFEYTYFSFALVIIVLFRWPRRWSFVVVGTTTGVIISPRAAPSFLMTACISLCLILLKGEKKPKRAISLIIAWKPGTMLFLLGWRLATSLACQMLLPHFQWISVYDPLSKCVHDLHSCLH